VPALTVAVKVLPFPSSLSRRTRPPCKRTNSHTRANPIPVPSCVARLRFLHNARSAQIDGLVLPPDAYARSATASSRSRLAPQVTLMLLRVCLKRWIASEHVSPHARRDRDRIGSGV